MKVLVDGHRYSVANFEDDGSAQEIQFIQKAPVVGTTIGELYTISNGTTNEEVLAVLIDRMKSQNAKLPSRESSIVITKLEESLMWLEKRTADRKKRQVEGKMLA